MRAFRAAALVALPIVALLSGPASAQNQSSGSGGGPNINLMPELQSRTPEEKEADAIKEKAYRESLRKIPDAKTAGDPWGNVRAPEPATAAPKSKTKTGSTAN